MSEFEMMCENTIGTICFLVATLAFAMMLAWGWSINIDQSILGIMLVPTAFAACMMLLGFREMLRLSQNRRAET